MPPTETYAKQLAKKQFNALSDICADLGMPRWYGPATNALAFSQNRWHVLAARCALRAYGAYLRVVCAFRG